jgi:hypothetical protein
MNQQNEVFGINGIDVENLLANLKLTDFERAFLMQGSCPMSKKFSHQRMDKDPMFDLVPEAHKEYLSSYDYDVEPRVAGLGSAKLSGVPGFYDSEDNREGEMTEIVSDYEAQDKQSFSSFEEWGAYHESQAQTRVLENMSLYEINVRRGSIDGLDYELLPAQKIYTNEEAAAYNLANKNVKLDPINGVPKIIVSNSVLDETLARKQQEAEANAKTSFPVHLCDEYMKRRYPELKNNGMRCQLCSKVAPIGIKLYEATGNRGNKQTMNASVMHVDPDVELMHLESTIKMCTFIKRSAMLDEILAQFTNQFKVGRLLDDIQFNIDWDVIQARVRALEVDANSIGTVDMARNAAGKSEFNKFQDGILAKAMRTSTTKILVEKCITQANLVYVRADKELSPEAEGRIESFIKGVAEMYLKRYKMMTNLRWRMKNGKKDQKGNPKYHTTPVVCTKCNMQYSCQGAIIKLHVLKDYPMHQRN